MCLTEKTSGKLISVFRCTHTHTSGPRRRGFLTHLSWTAGCVESYTQATVRAAKTYEGADPFFAWRESFSISEAVFHRLAGTA